jgi:type II secretory pathway component PulF
MPGSVAARWAFRWAVRRQFYGQIIAQNANGVPLRRCLELYEKRAARGKAWAITAIARSMRTAMDSGYDFAEAVAPWVPLDEIAMVSAGVIGQNIPQALERLIETKTIVQEISSHVRNALITPVMNLVVGLGFVMFMAIVVVPQFQGIVPRSAASGSVAALYDLGDFVTGWGFAVLLLALLGAGGALVYTLPRWTGPARLMFDNYFPWSLYREFQGYLWMTGFVSIIGAGMREIKALEIQARRAPPWLTERLNMMSRDMASGSSLPQAMLAPRYAGKGFGFPSEEIVDTIEAIHGFEDFPGRMSGVLRQWILHLTARVKAAGTAVGVVGSVLTYGVIIFITVASVNLQTQLQQRTGNMTIQR